jgi:glutamate receptor, ionotropic, plant
MIVEEKLESILSKIVVIVWVFFLLVLTSSYTASLSSMLTAQQLEPTVTSVNELIKNGDYVGYGKGSFVKGVLEELNFEKSKIKSYNFEDFADALQKGNSNGGVAAIVDERPYLKLILAKHCKSYTMIDIYKSAGFGFVS